MGGHWWGNGQMVSGSVESGLISVPVDGESHSIFTWERVRSSRDGSGFFGFITENLLFSSLAENDTVASFEAVRVFAGERVGLSDVFHDGDWFSVQDVSSNGNSSTSKTSGSSQDSISSLKSSISSNSSKTSGSSQYSISSLQGSISSNSTGFQCGISSGSGKSSGSFQSSISALQSSISSNSAGFQGSISGNSTGIQGSISSSASNSSGASQSSISHIGDSSEWVQNRKRLCRGNSQEDGHQKHRFHFGEGCDVRSGNKSLPC